MAQNFDAFTEGVGLGGIRTKNEIRVLLCYLLSGISTEISKSGLNEVLQSLQAVISAVSAAIKKEKVIKYDRTS